ncbi:hypothetical protein DFH27DRAFT_465861, partial [Peziza echinospora]
PDMTGETDSSGYHPGADLSSFDASTSRAPAGYRNTPGAQHDAWAAEEGEDIPKTWEEGQERRKRAEQELQRRREIAQKEEEERRLGEEFWQGEEDRFGPVVPPVVQQQRPPEPPLQFLPPPSPPPIAPQSDSLLLLDPVPIQEPPSHSQTPAPAPQPSAPAAQTDVSDETYQIKHINWVDPITSQMRRSPILLQNGNGPCPLLALVNALVLSTPPDISTSLLEVLQVREHVSLGLLMDAVFDGAVSRVSTQGPEIDFSDLFSFLMSLKTGMNVNPSYVSPAGSEPPKLGTFEFTKEMKLYNSFLIPLYHGWLPHPQSRVYSVLQRVAPTYEEVQNILLQEEIIIHRISTAENGDVAGQATPEEQKLIEDAAVIRDWHDDSRTQLTEWGLENLTRNWDSSHTRSNIGILFRNDHFLTIMKGRIPGSDRPVLLGLVTDMGYGGYEEVVWESLVSIRGEGGQFLTGDLRPVGDGHPDRPRQGRGRPVQSLLDVGDNDGWQTAGSQRRTSSRNDLGGLPLDMSNLRVNAAPPPPPPPPQPSDGTGEITNTDYDLALAMQLQEEEDERERQ